MSGRKTRSRRKVGSKEKMPKIIGGKITRLQARATCAWGKGFRWIRFHYLEVWKRLNQSLFCFPTGELFIEGKVELDFIFHAPIFWSGRLRNKNFFWSFFKPRKKKWEKNSRFCFFSRSFRKHFGSFRSNSPLKISRLGDSLHLLFCLLRPIVWPRFDDKALKPNLVTCVEWAMSNIWLLRSCNEEGNKPKLIKSC